jgi:integrase/recombinase XerC
LLIQELIFRYLESLEKERLMSAHTVRAYRRDLEFFAEWLTSINCCETEKIQHLSSAQIRSFWASRRNSGISSQSMRRGQSALRGLVRYALKHRLISQNPLAAMDSPKAQRPLPKALAGEDINMLINAPDVQTLQGLRDRAILETLYGSGLRVSETAGLTCEQLDFDNQKARIRGKGNKERIVPLTPACCSAIGNYLGRRHQEMPAARQESHIFLNRQGSPLTERSIARVIDKYSRQLAMMLNITPHQFRHSFATHLLNNGADMRAVQEMLGHASMSTTQIYTRISKERLMQTYKLTHPRSGGSR